MRGNWVSLLLPTVLTAALVAVPAADAWGTVVLCESELSPSGASVFRQDVLMQNSDYRPSNEVFDEVVWSRLEIGLGEIVSSSWLSLPSGMGGEPLGPPDEQPRQDRRQRFIQAVSHAPADMAPTSTSLLSQGNGSGGNSALPVKLLIPPQTTLQASLPPEAKTILPTGPPWRLFRPPRNVFRTC